MLDGLKKVWDGLGKVSGDLEKLSNDFKKECFEKVLSRKNLEDVGRSQMVLGRCHII